jgi:hypothetical protein
MAEIQIKIKFNKGEQIIKEFTVLSDMFIDDLRIIIEEEFKIAPYKQNLIFKGKMLQNQKKIEDYKISNNDIILLVEKVGETGDKVGLSNISAQSGVGARGQINYDLLKQPMGSAGDINQMIEAMKIPEIAGQVETLFDDPNVLDAMMQNPQIKAMCDMNPHIKDLITNKELMKSMLQPENLERMKKIQEGTATMQDIMNMVNPNGGANNNTNLDINNNNWINTNNNFNNPLGMFGMPMINPFMMNPMMMGLPNIFGQGFRNNNFNNNLNNNNIRPGIKKRIQSAKPKIRTDLKKNMTMNSMNTNLNIEKNGDEIIPNIQKEKNHEMYPDIYKNRKNDSGPKIMKVIKKTSNKKFGNKDIIDTN